MLEIDYLQNRAGALALLVDDETVILPTGRRVHFAEVKHAWVYSDDDHDLAAATDAQRAAVESMNAAEIARAARSADAERRAAERAEAERVDAERMDAAARWVAAHIGNGGERAAIRNADDAFSDNPDWAWLPIAVRQHVENRRFVRDLRQLTRLVRGGF